LISKDSIGDASRVKAISGRTGVTLVSMETVGMWRRVGFLARAFRCFSEAGLSVDLVSTSESNVTVTLDKGTAPVDSHALSDLRRRLEQLCRVQILEHVEIVSLVGQKIRGMLHEIGPALEVFDEYRIHLVSQAASDLNLSFVVEEGRAQKLIQELHAILVKPSVDDDLFGETWEQLHQDQSLHRPSYEPWWVS
jgi:diaminopimelate decarboxylase/aspartate kinase